DREAWWSVPRKHRQDSPLGWTEPADGLLAPQHDIKRIGELTGPEGVYVAAVGQHQMWAAQFVYYERPGAWLNSAGLG
ncbi:hypothetical protein M2C68_22645, partial [Pseudomonas sp. BAgro211]|nr:hypothetical protein [Pseudomonas sp. BAgro211]